MDMFDRATEVERMHREAALSSAGTQRNTRPSRSTCAKCGTSIPEARRKAVPGVQLCVRCQQKADA